MLNRISKKFHFQAKNFIGKGFVPNDESLWPKEWKVITYKEYTRFPRIELLKTKIPPVSFFEVLDSRKSFRDFSQSTPVPIEKLSPLLYYGAGIRTTERDLENTRRFYPSGGARYPLEVYLVSSEDKKLSSGLYHYHVPTNSLEKIGDKELFEKIQETLTTDFAKRAPTLLIITSVWERTFNKYQDFGYTTLLLEAGHLAQNILLLSTSLGIKSCPIAGYRTKELSKALGLNPLEEAPVHLIVLGN